MSRFLDPRADLTFKKIFGEHPHLVISLLNAMLPLKEDERVESIEYWPAEKIPDRTEIEKYSIVDVCCRDNKKREFIVEMQMTWTEAFKKRVLLNASKAYVAQSEKGMNFEALQPVYALNFINETFLPDVEEYYHHYQLVHECYTDKVIDGLQLVFIELPKFRPNNFAEKRMQVLWLRFLTEINEKTRVVPPELLESPEVRQAIDIVERAAFNDAEMRAYDKFWDRISTQRTLEEELKARAEKYLRLMEAEKAKAEELKAETEELKARAEEEKVKTKELKVKTEELKARAEELKVKTEELKARAEEEKARAEELKVKTEELKARAEEEKAKAEEEKAKTEELKARAEEEKARAEELKARAEEEKARAEEEKAKAERLEQEKLETARKMKSDGLTIEVIIKYTGLDSGTILSL